MTQSPTLILIALVAACLVLGACAGPTDPENGITNGSAERGPTAGPALQTDSDRYTAGIDENEHFNVRITIPLVFVNPMDEMVYMIGCRRLTMPILESFEDAEWEVAYAGVELDCLSPPFPIEPREAFRDTLLVRARFPAQSIHPGFGTDVDGTYPLVRSIYTDPDGEHLLDESLRTSNTFELAAQQK